YHFEGTDQLYDTVVCEGRARFREMAEEALAEPADPATRLRRLAGAYARFGREDPTLLRLLCMELFGPLDNVAPECADRGAAELRGWLERELGAVTAELGGGAEADPFAVRLFTALMN